MLAKQPNWVHHQPWDCPTLRLLALREAGPQTAEDPLRHYFEHFGQHFGQHGLVEIEAKLV